MEIFAMALLLMTLLASTDRSPTVPEPPAAVEAPAAGEHPAAVESTAVVQAATLDSAEPAADPGARIGPESALPACDEVLYRNLSVPVEQAVYWQADGRRCDPEQQR
jgi:hypothetical protein